MPAPDAFTPATNARPALGHVNLMVDTFIANANVDDLRSIIRGVLGSGIPGVANAFTSAARDRLRQTNAKSLPAHQPLFAKQSGVAHPTPHLQIMLARARSIYGAGMGFDSLAVLSEIVRATHGLRWHSAGLMANVLADIDSDISQAIQSSKEEIEAGRVEDYSAARYIVDELRCAVNDSYDDVRLWGGEFPFERAVTSIEFWKL